MRHYSYRQVADLIQYRCDLLLAGRYEDLARHNTLPLVTYQGGHPTVIRTLDGMVQMFHQLRHGLSMRGIVALQADVTAMDLPRAGRIRVWVRYSEVDAQGGLGMQSDCVMFLRQFPSGLRSEMIEFKQCPEVSIRAA